MEGEILGMVFSMIEMIWNLGLRKSKRLADHLWVVAEAADPLSLLEVKKLSGRVSEFAQLAPQLSLLTSNLNQFLGSLMSTHPERDSKDKGSTCLAVPEVVKDDCRGLAAIVADTVDNPLPIIVKFHHDLLAMPVHTDASGCLSERPSWGILVSKYGTFFPLVVSLQFPHKFLCSMDTHGPAI